MMMNTTRRRFTAIASLSLAMGLFACAASQTDLSLTGTLSRKGSQMESFWAVRLSDGKIWQLAANAAQNDQLSALQFTSIRVTGKADTTTLPFPTLTVQRIEAAQQ